MRIRTIKPEFYQSETMSRVPREVRDLAKGLISYCDDEGYFRSHPRLIAAAIYPLDADGPEFVAAGLEQLSGIGFAHLFEGGTGYLPGFEENQRINRVTPSKLKPKALVILEPKANVPPTPTHSVSPHAQLSESSVSPHGALTHNSVSPHGVLSEVVHREGKGSGREVEEEQGASLSSQATEVFAHWLAVFGKNANTVFGSARQSKVEARLREGYDVEQLKRAVDGCALTPHNRGATDGTVYDDLELICRSASHVDRFIRNANSPPQARSRNGPVDPGAINFPLGELNL